jgi:hypothetical protein
MRVSAFVAAGLALALVASLSFHPLINAGSGTPTPIGGIAIEPSSEPLRLAGCVVTPRPPDELAGLVRAMAGFRCAANGGRRNVTIELWQRDGNGFWRPVPETDETFATSPGMGSAPHPSGPRRSLPLGPDEISCLASPPDALRRYRTYAAAFGPNGEPLLHASPESVLLRDCLGGMAREHAAALGIPRDSDRRVRLPPREFLRTDPVCPAFLLSPHPMDAADCPDASATTTAPAP